MTEEAGTRVLSDTYGGCQKSAELSSAVPPTGLVADSPQASELASARDRPPEDRPSHGYNLRTRALCPEGQPSRAAK